MAVAAVILAFVTMLIGVMALGDLVEDDAGRPVQRVAVIHATVASLAVITLLVAFVTTDRAVAWVSAGAMVVAGAIGLWLFRSTGTRAVSTPILAAHGAAAFATIVSVAVAAAAAGVFQH